MVIDSFECYLTLSDFRTYIYVRNKQTVATRVRQFTYTDFALKIDALTRLYTRLYGNIRESRTCAEIYYRRLFREEKFLNRILKFCPTIIDVFMSL